MNPQDEVVFDSEFQCNRINGILCPEPEKIIYCPRQPPSSSSPKDVPPVPESSGKKRDLSASTVTNNKEISLKLFHCQRTLKYILQIREVETNAITWYVLEPYGRGRIKVRETKDNDWVLVPITEENFPNYEGKYPLSLGKRLEGKWRMETRKRKNSDMTDYYYYHEKVKKMMRSLYEVATFIMYNKTY